MNLQREQTVEEILDEMFEALLAAKQTPDQASQDESEAKAVEKAVEKLAKREAQATTDGRREGAEALAATIKNATPKEGANPLSGYSTGFEDGVKFMNDKADSALAEYKKEES